MKLQFPWHDQACVFGRKKTLKVREFPKADERPRKLFYVRIFIDKNIH